MLYRQHDSEDVAKLLKVVSSLFRAFLSAACAAAVYTFYLVSSNTSLSEIAIQQDGIRHFTEDSTSRNNSSLQAKNESIPYRPSIGAFLSSPSTSSEADPYSRYEIVTTKFGWLSNETLNFPRSLLEAELFHAVTSHPSYNAGEPSKDKPIIVFLDVGTCAEKNYPRYNGGYPTNADTQGGRVVVDVHSSAKPCNYLRKVIHDTSLLQHPDSRVVMLNCRGGPGVNCRRRKKPREDYMEEMKQVVVAYYSANVTEVRRGMDVGIFPPAVKSIQLSDEQRRDIQQCKRTRKYLFSFQGKFGPHVRQELASLNNGRDVIGRVGNDHFRSGDLQLMDDFVMDYTAVVQNSLFVGAPRGDNLFSYRFSEILSAGAIPVVFADDWLPPFQTTIDWSQCAVFLPQNQGAQTIQLLKNISNEKVCQMQQCGLDLWDKYASSREGWVRGLIEVAIKSREISNATVD
jgi:hypothetical protein